MIGPVETEEGAAVTEGKVWTERIKVTGDALVDKTKELLHEGNVRRIVVKNAEGQTVMELPMTFGVLGAVAAPFLAAVGAIAGLAANWRLEIERVEPRKDGQETMTEPPASDG
jgi:hypothetical protein